MDTEQTLGGLIEYLNGPDRSRNELALSGVLCAALGAFLTGNSEDLLRHVDSFREAQIAAIEKAMADEGLRIMEGK